MVRSVPVSQKVLDKCYLLSNAVLSVVALMAGRWAAYEGPWAWVHAQSQGCGLAPWASRR